MVFLPQLPIDVGHVILAHLAPSNPFELAAYAQPLAKNTTHPLYALTAAAQSDHAWHKFSPAAARQAAPTTSLYDAFLTRMRAKTEPELRRLRSIYRGDYIIPDYQDFDGCLAEVSRPDIHGAFYKAPAHFVHEHAICLAAVTACGDRLQQIRGPLRQDYAINLAAVVAEPQALADVEEPMRSHFLINLAAVRGHGYALRFVRGDLRHNHAIKMAAVRCYGASLQYVHDPLQQSYALCLAAVSQEGDALRWVQGDLRQNVAINLAAVKQSSSALLWVEGEMRNHHAVNLAAVEASPLAYRWVRGPLRDDPVILAAHRAHSRPRWFTTLRRLLVPPLTGPAN